MFQTLLLVPGQPGIFLEHSSKVEAENVLRNVKVACAYHNGEEVTAIPLNYNPTDPRLGVHITLDLKDIPEDKRQEFVETAKKITNDHILKYKGQA